jgi:hypothetical protein
MYARSCTGREAKRCRKGRLCLCRERILGCLISAWNVQVYDILMTANPGQAGEQATRRKIESYNKCFDGRAW